MFKRKLKQQKDFYFGYKVKKLCNDETDEG